MYIFQYPNRPSGCKPLPVKKCFVKPKSRQAKLDIELNPSSSSFNTAKAEDIAVAVDGVINLMVRSDDDKDVFFESGLMDKVTYTSSQVIENTDSFAVGAYNGKEYHISPLKGENWLWFVWLVSYFAFCRFFTDETLFFTPGPR